MGKEEKRSVPEMKSPFQEVAEEMVALNAVGRLVQGIDWEGLAGRVSGERINTVGIKIWTISIAPSLDREAARERDRKMGFVLGQLVGGKKNLERLWRGYGIEGDGERLAAALVASVQDNLDLPPGEFWARVKNLGALFERVREATEKTKGGEASFLFDPFRGVVGESVVGESVVGESTVVGACLRAIQKKPGVIEETVVERDEMQVARAALATQLKEVNNRILAGEDPVEVVEQILGKDSFAKNLAAALVTTEHLALTELKGEAEVESLVKGIKEVEEKVLGGQDPYTALAEVFGKDTPLGIALSAVAAAAEARAEEHYRESVQAGPGKEELEMGPKPKEEITAENLGLPETVEIAGEPMEVGEGKNLLDRIANELAAEGRWDGDLTEADLADVIQAVGEKLALGIEGVEANILRPVVIIEEGEGKISITIQVTKPLRGEIKVSCVLENTDEARGIRLANKGLGVKVPLKFKAFGVKGRVQEELSDPNLALFNALAGQLASRGMALGKAEFRFRGSTLWVSLKKK